MKEDSDRKLNQQALLIMNNAESSYRGGDLEGALELYEEVVRNYKDSDYTGKALEEIKSINSQMREVNITTTLALDGGDSITGVVVQILPGSSVLINLGSEDNIEIGNELRILRKAEKGVEIIGSLKVYSVSPKTSRGKLVYFDKDIKVGDIVSFSQLP